LLERDYRVDDTGRGELPLPCMPVWFIRKLAMEKIWIHDDGVEKGITGEMVVAIMPKDHSCVSVPFAKSARAYGLSVIEIE